MTLVEGHNTLPQMAQLEHEGTYVTHLLMLGYIAGQHGPELIRIYHVQCAVWSVVFFCV